MHLVAIGLNHKTAPVEVRETIAVSEGNLPEALERLIACHCVAECCILSTCNRTEIYAVTTKHEDEEALIDFLFALLRRGKDSPDSGADYCCRNPDEGRASFEGHLYRHRGHKAVEHLFCVTSGIDSMMIGETQIVGQVKTAFCVADESDSTRAILNTLFQQALSVGKRARTETDISRGAFSVGYAAVELAGSIFGNLAGRTILILGAGKMSELTAKHMKNAGATSVLVANRTLSRAEELAAKLGGRALPFDSLQDGLARADIVIGSTGSTEPIIKRDEMAKIMRLRRERPVFFIDIAVPRDIEAGVGDLDNVFVYDIDDLQSLVEQSGAERHKEIEKVREIVAEETRKFSAWMKTLEAVPLIKLLRDKLEEIKDGEWERTSGKLAHLTEKDKETIQTMMQSLINKISHDPLIKIKEYASGTNGYDKLEIARELFGVGNGEGEAPSEPQSAISNQQSAIQEETE